MYFFKSLLLDLGSDFLDISRDIFPKSKQILLFSGQAKKKYEMPQVPIVPQILQVPQMPQIPQIPQVPQVPQVSQVPQVLPVPFMPQMPSYFPRIM